MSQAEWHTDQRPFQRVSMDHPLAHFNEALGLPLHLERICPFYGDRFTSRLSYFPFHGHLDVNDYSFEPAFIRKRNERERQRVRCVNEGYARLREHLPQEFEDKRLSKVETLRAAVDYIKHLQSILNGSRTRGMEEKSLRGGQLCISAKEDIMQQC